MIKQFRDKILADIAAYPEEGCFHGMLLIFDGYIEEGKSFEEAKRAAENWLHNYLEDEAHDDSLGD